MMPASIGYTSGTTADPKGVIHASNSAAWPRRCRSPRYDVDARRAGC